MIDTRGFQSLQSIGVGLLEGEQTQFSFELETKHGVLVLTNKRVISCIKTGRSSKVTAASIKDIDLVEIEHSRRNVWYLIFGILLVPILIGIILLVRYFHSGKAKVTFKVGGTDFPGQLEPRKADEVYAVMQRFFWLKETK